MSYFREVELGSSFGPFSSFRDQFGFVPNLFRAQTLAPRIIEAEATLIASILFNDRNLSRTQKEYILLISAAAQGNVYVVSGRYQMLQLLGIPETNLDRILADRQHADLSPEDTALIDFALGLGRRPNGMSDESLLEAVLTAALASLLCTLSIGVGSTPEFRNPSIPAGPREPLLDARNLNLRGPHLDPEGFAPFAFFRDQFGSIPDVFQAQTWRLDVLEAEASAIQAVLLPEDLLTRAQKERMLLAKSAPESNEALLDFAAKLIGQPSEFGRDDVQFLRLQGFTEEQVLEAVATTAFASFFHSLQLGLGVTPDFASIRIFQPIPAKKTHLSAFADRLSGQERLDPDFEIVDKVQEGDLDAFEELIKRHNRRVYRTLVGILGNVDDARDAMQDTFLKAFQKIGGFERRSKFSTWLLSIAANTGIERLRERKRFESLDDNNLEAEDGFRPRHIQAWAENPEQLYSHAESRSLVEASVMKLPAKYRVVVMLRDIEQLPTEDAAATLGLGIPALKARLLRGRLMLRESLSPHFATPAKGVTS